MSEPRPVDEGAVAAVAEVLAGHDAYEFRWTKGPQIVCRCAALLDCDEADDVTIHRTHTAAALLASPSLTDLLTAAEQRGRVAAWDEGYTAAWKARHDQDDETNPYRERADRETR